MKTARAITDSLDKLYSKYLFEGDSMALFGMYAKGAYMNRSTGDDILHSISKWIQYSIRTNTRTVVFTTTTLTIDGDFMIETGTTAGKDDKSNVKYESKYLVVWKPENGTWKLYRDISL
jgi:ketosteroid isomerase-like protein